jgi:predicted anti-sigma-YlaC factor YlaD
MKCSKIQRLLSNYVDGSVSEDEKRLIEDHLKICIICQRELAAYHKLRRTLDTEEGVPVSDNFEGRVLKKIRGYGIPLRSNIPLHRHLQKWKYAGAVIAILALTIFCGNYVGKTLYKEYSKARPDVKPVIERSVYQFGLSCEIPDSSFSVKYLNLRM